MYLLQAIYPVLLASINMAMGWLLYGLLESAIGGLLILVGLLVILASLGSALSNHRSALKQRRVNLDP